MHRCIKPYVALSMAAETAGNLLGVEPKDYPNDQLGAGTAATGELHLC